MRVMVTLTARDDYDIAVDYRRGQQTVRHFHETGIYADQLPTVMLSVDSDYDLIDAHIGHENRMWRKPAENGRSPSYPNQLGGRPLSYLPRCRPAASCSRPVTGEAGSTGPARCGSNRPRRRTVASLLRHDTQGRAAQLRGSSSPRPFGPRGLVVLFVVSFGL